MTFQPLTTDKVYSVYSGRPGCCCGCRGKHTYASRHRDWASRNRGYPVRDEEVNDRTVTLIVNKINKAGSIHPTFVDVKPGYYFMDIGSRYYVAYVRD